MANQQQKGLHRILGAAYLVCNRIDQVLDSDCECAITQKKFTKLGLQLLGYYQALLRRLDELATIEECLASGARPTKLEVARCTNFWGGQHFGRVAKAAKPEKAFAAGKLEAEYSAGLRLRGNHRILFRSGSPWDLLDRLEQGALISNAGPFEQHLAPRPGQSVSKKD